MITSWILYSIAVSALLGLCALALEFGLRQRRLAVRWLWVGSLCGSVALTAAPLVPDDAPPPPTPTGQTAGFAGEMSTGEVAAFELSIPAAESTSTLSPAVASVLRMADRLILPIWGAASALALLILFGAHHRLARRRRLWRPTLLDGVPVLIARDVGPAVVGWHTATIVLPEWVRALDPQRRQLVLAHEVEHVRAGDPRLLIAAYLVAAALPWNAALWWQIRRLRHAVELDCDARVLRGTVDAASYGELLLDVGTRGTMGRLGLAAFAESSSFLSQRIADILSPPPRPWRLFVGGSAAIAGVILIAACETPTPPLAESSQAASRLDTPPAPTATAAVPGTRATAGDPPTEAVTIRNDRLATAPVAESSSRAAGQGERGGAADDGVWHELELRVRGNANVLNTVELVRSLHPELLQSGLPLQEAVWFAIDREGRIVKSWVGPNLYMNFEDYQPVRWHDLPEGSAEAAQAMEEHRQRRREITEAEVPGVRFEGTSALFIGQPVPINVHLVTENAGRPVWGGKMSIPEEIVIRTREPIAGTKLTLPEPMTITWEGRQWNSRPPARIMDPAQLRRVGEVDGTAIYVDAGAARPEAIFQLQRAPDVFLPYLRP